MFILSTTRRCPRAIRVADLEGSTGLYILFQSINASLVRYVYAMYICTHNINAFLVFDCVFHHQSYAKRISIIIITVVHKMLPQIKVAGCIANIFLRTAASTIWLVKNSYKIYMICMVAIHLDVALSSSLRDYVQTI